MKTIIRTLISLGFLVGLFFLMRGNFPEILSALKNADWRFLAAAFLVSLTMIVIGAKRLQIIFIARETPIRFWHCCNITLIGFFFNNFLPTSVGGDIVKAMCAARITGDSVRAVSSIVMDRIFGFFMVILIPSFSFLFLLKSNENPVVPIVIYSALAASLIGFLLVFHRGAAKRLAFIGRFLDRFVLGTKIRKLHEDLRGFGRHKSLMIKAVLLSLLGQSAGIVMIYLLALSLGAQLSIIYFFILIPVVGLISMLPSLNGLGIREGAYIYFLGPHIGKENAAALGVLFLGLLFLLSIIGGIIYLINDGYRNIGPQSPLNNVER